MLYQDRLLDKTILTSVIIFSSGVPIVILVKHFFNDEIIIHYSPTFLNLKIFPIPSHSGIGSIIGFSLFCLLLPTEDLDLKMILEQVSHHPLHILSSTVPSIHPEFKFGGKSVEIAMHYGIFTIVSVFPHREDLDLKMVLEQVSHHPPVSAFHCQCPHFEFYGSIYPKLKFWGKSVEIAPKGLLTIKLNK